MLLRTHHPSRIHGRPWLLPAAASLLAATLGSGGALAQTQSAPVDVVIEEAPPPRRVLTLEYNPVALLIRRISADVIFSPIDHHALILSPYYFDATTPSFTDSQGAQVLSQRFQGYGGEIGYRYYFGLGGPRGWFVGPSFLIANVRATAGDGSQQTITDEGVAVDIGYQALVADRWTVSLGGGAQYTFTSESLPDQQMPAAIYANAGLRPRVLFALGCAF